MDDVLDVLPARLYQHGDVFDFDILQNLACLFFSRCVSTQPLNAFNRFHLILACARQHTDYQRRSRLVWDLP